MKDLFCQDDDTLVFGAAPNEEFIGYTQVRNLIEKDWNLILIQRKVADDL